MKAWRSSGAAAALGLAAFCAGCGGPRSEDEAATAGRETAATLVAAVSRAATAAEPFRCAEMTGPPADGPVAEVSSRRGRRGVQVLGGRLLLGPVWGDARDRVLVAGIVADSRGATAATLTQIGRIRAELEREEVEVVVSLGGLGTGEDEITRVLEALSRDAPWVVWAIPGEREDVGAHRAAVARLAAAGAPAFDGGVIRLLEVDGVVLGSLPGGSAPGQLAAGAEGCVHRAEDAMALAARLAAQEGVRIWAGHTPPRQTAGLSSDTTLGGVHVGDPDVAAALPASRARVVVHGLVDEAALGASTGQRSLAGRGEPAILGSGPIEAMPIQGPEGVTLAGGALILRVDAGADELKWRRVQLPLGGASASR